MSRRYFDRGRDAEPHEPSGRTPKPGPQVERPLSSGPAFDAGRPAVRLGGAGVREPGPRAGPAAALPRAADLGGQIRRKPSGLCACGGIKTEASTQCPACNVRQAAAERAGDAAAAGGHAPLPIPPSVRETLNSPGHPLDPAARSFMESRMGQSFAHLRVHSDARAAESARSVGALAYTVGNHVVFGAGEYAPNTRGGRSLLAHELAHVVQQGRGGGSRVQPTLSLGSENDSHEREADRAAESVMGGGERPLKGLTPAGGLIQRTCHRPPLPRATACVRDSGDITGETFLFVRGCDDLRTDTGRRGAPGTGTGEEAALLAFASTLNSGDRVDIHGFASEEGDLAYNESLSCLRAQSAARIIMRAASSRGVSVNLRLFMHGEAGGRPLADRRKVVVKVARPAPRPPTPAPTPTPPTPCVPTVVTGTSPALIYHHGAAASGRDFIHGDYPFSQVAALPWLKRTAVLSAIGLPDLVLIGGMANVLGVLGGAEGLVATAHFRSGAGGAITYGPGSNFSTLASSALRFRLAAAVVERLINAAVRAQAPTCNIDYRTIRIPTGAVPAIAFYMIDSIPLKAVIGGTQALWVSINRFSSSPGRTYTAVVSFDIYDDFGVDESDIYSPGLLEFYVLQHFRTSYRPFVHRIVVERTITGSY